MPENNQLLSVESQLVGLPLAGPESFSQQQLDYLKRALGVDETVLWETASSGVESGDITVSEAITNFEKYEIYGFETERGGTFVNTFAYSQIPFDYSSIITKPNDNNGSYAFSINMFCAGNLSQWRQTYFGCRCHWNSTFTQMTIDSNHAAYVNKDANGTFNAINQKLRITKIVGIGRKESA